MTIRKTFFFFFCLASITFFSFDDNSNAKLRTDGYYYTYDTLVNTRTKETRIRFYPIILFDNQTLSDFYFQHSQKEFEKLLSRKKYKWIEKYSEFGSYKIIDDSIYIHEKTWSNKWFGSNKGEMVDMFMKGIILNDTTFRIAENIFNRDTIKQSTNFKFTSYAFKK